MKNKKPLLFIAAVCGITMGAFAVTAYTCSTMHDYGSGKHYVYCPDHGCIPYATPGVTCTYCDGTGVDRMWNSGGCNTAYYEHDFDCGYWWQGVCGWWGSCVSAVRKTRCWRDRYTSSC
jgi:hypothetical protein